MSKPFVIVNHHRSGSNFLCRLLKANKDVRCLNEPLSQHMGVFEEYDLVEFNNENIDEFLRGNEKHFLEQMKEYICESPNVSGFKDTCLYGKMNWMLEEFEGIKVIHLVRNPLAVVNSCLRNNMWKHWNYEYVINRYRQNNGLNVINDPFELCLESWKIRSQLYAKEMSEKKAFEIRLEDLTMDPYGELKKLMNYLELDVSPEQIRILNECYKQKKGKEYSIYRKKEDVLTDWKKYLNNKDMDVAVKELESGVPVQYIVGNVDFYGYIFDVNQNVLIPRFETELLVDKTINYIKNFFDSDINILDIGTGSGCIAITLSKELKLKVDAIDISKDALCVASNNAKKLGADVDFSYSDIFSNVNESYNVVISNPPYIRYDEEIDDIVRDNEPNIALFASDDGLYFYENILKDCRKHLKAKFLMAFEIGIMQGEAVKELAIKYLGNDVNIKIEKDYSNRDRYVFISNLY